MTKNVKNAKSAEKAAEQGVDVKAEEPATGKQSEESAAGDAPAVVCVVLEKFKDKETGDVRRRGDVVMVSEARFAELAAGGRWVREIGRPGRGPAEADEAIGGSD